MTDEFDKLIRLLALRKISLARLGRLEEGESSQLTEKLVANQRKLVRKAELELALLKTKKMLECYRYVLEGMERDRESTHCPACRYMYKTPDGRKLTDKEIMEMGCTLHPGKEYTGECDDFENYGIMKWDVHYRLKYRDINSLKGLVKKTEKDIGKLEQELNS